MNKIIATIGSAVMATIWASSSYAIPFSYGEATHDTTEWQELATGPDKHDYGISWTLDGGSTWGQTLDLYVGQTVQFKLNLQDNDIGTHYGNLAKAWVDWEQDGFFDSTDSVAYGLNVLRPYKDAPAASPANHEYISAIYTLTNDNVGDDLWVRALATCSESVVSRDGGSHVAGVSDWDAQWTLDYINNYESRLVSTGHYAQGETEEFKLSVHAVPEPSTMLLLGLGIAGLVVRRRVVVK
jgi:hypothetical protein